MLYGISLLVGKFGTGYLPEVTLGLVSSLQPGANGITLTRLSSWARCSSWWASGSNWRRCHSTSGVPTCSREPPPRSRASCPWHRRRAALALLARVILFLGGLDSLVPSTDAVGGVLPWQSVVRYLVPALAFFAALTATFGNLAAYSQTNLKRLLAYSTIAHAGYMMMGLCTLSRAGVEAMLFYLVAYLFMNLGAFAVIAFLRNSSRSEDLADFRGLIRRSPVMVIALCFFLLSLLGIPPLIGFAAKFQIFAVLYNEGTAFYRADEPGLGAILCWAPARGRPEHRDQRVLLSESHEGDDP